MKRGGGPGRHGDEAAEEVGVAEEERDGEGARVGGRDDDHAAARLPVRRQDGPDQLAQEGGAVPDAGAPRLSSPWVEGATLRANEKPHKVLELNIHSERLYWKKLASLPVVFWAEMLSVFLYHNVTKKNYASALFLP